MWDATAGHFTLAVEVCQTICKEGLPSFQAAIHGLIDSNRQNFVENFHHFEAKLPRGNRGRPF